VTWNSRRPEGGRLKPSLPRLAAHVSSLTGPCLAGLLVSGCAALSGDTGFADVERLISERTGEAIHWQVDSMAEDAVRARVRALLGEELTAPGAVRVALLNHASLQAGLEELGIGRAELVQAGLLRNPVLSATLRFPDRGSGTNLEFSLVQEFLAVLSLPLRRRVAAIRFEQIKLRAADAVLALAAETEAAYYQAQGSFQALANQLMLEEVAELGSEVAQRLHEAGNITDLTLARQRTEFEQARAARLRAETDVELALGGLRSLLGVDPEVELVLAPRLEELPAAEIDGHGLAELAVAERLDVAMARLEERLLAESAGGARLAAIQPDLALGFEAEREVDASWLIGPSLRGTLPLFDTGRAAVAVEQGRARRAGWQTVGLETQARNEAWQAHRQLLAARGLAEQYRDVLLPLAAMVVEETQLQYNAMQLGIFALLQAKRDQLVTEGEYARTLQAYWLARVKLARAVGGRLPPPIPLEPPTGKERRPAPVPEEQQPAIEHHQH
jgi:outer membrane protein, heavy metal efflux system